MQDPIYEKLNRVPRPTPFAACGLILVAALGLWLSALLELVLPEADAALVNLAYYLPFLALPVAAYMLKFPGLSDGMRLKPLPVLPTLGVILLGLISVYAASALGAVWEYGLNALGLRGLGAVAQPGTRRELALSILSMAALPAVCEELLFRGFVLSAWESRGTWHAIVVTAALFALLHANLFGLPVYFLVGMVSGFIAFALDSLYASIVYHTVYNSACLILPWLLAGAASGEGGGGEAAITAALILQLILELAMLLAMMGTLLTAYRLRARTLGIEPIPRIRRPLEARDKVMLAALLAEMAASMLALIVISNLPGGG